MLASVRKSLYLFIFQLNSVLDLFPHYSACQEFATKFNCKRACFDKLIKRLITDTHSITSECQNNEKKIGLYSVQSILIVRVYV